MIGTFFKLVGKAIRFSIHRPLQRFNIYNRAKKYLGEDAKYFMPAPRAIGSLSKTDSTQYPHLMGSSGFKSVRQKRLEAVARRNQLLLEMEKSHEGSEHTTNKSFSETKRDDQIVIEASNKMPVIKTVTLVERHNSDGAPGDGLVVSSGPRPLPTSTSLQLSDPAVIWHVNKVPPGRLDLNKLQELLINKLADDAYWTPKQISETYNIKEEYAENIITYLRQIRIILSPRIASKLDYVARDDPAYQAYKDTIYYVDYSLRDEIDKRYDDTFLPTDELDPEVRRVLDGGRTKSPDQRLADLFKRPEPLRIDSLNKPSESSRKEMDTKGRRRLPKPDPPPEGQTVDK